MKLRLFTPVVALVFASAAAAAAPPPGDAGKSPKSANEDLVELGRSLLDAPGTKPAHKHHRKHSRGSAAPAEQPPATPPAAPDATGPTARPTTAAPASPASPASPTSPASPAPVAPPPLAAPLPGAAATPTPVAAAPAANLLLPAPQDAGTLPAQLPPSDAGAPADLLPAPVLPPPAEESIAAAEADEPSAPTAAGGPPKPPKHHRVSSRDARVRSGKNYPMQGAMQSPLARIGIPPAAVPAVATAAAVGATAFWPFLIKTLSGLLKSLLGSYLKNRAKKDKKIDDKQRAFVVLGFRVRPAELGSLFLAATVYGLAVCYTLKGWKLDSPFVLRQETLVLAIYYSRSFIRFTYERLFGLVTQFRFWPGGGLLCLGSAYLGNTLGTVGYDLEAAKSPEAAERAIRLKVWLIVIALGMALAFFTANWLYPQKVLQSGRLMTSGMALAEILPIAPMPGQKIYRWRRKVWVLLCVVVVPTFFLINFFL